MKSLNDQDTKDNVAVGDFNMDNFILLVHLSIQQQQQQQ